MTMHVTHRPGAAFGQPAAQKILPRDRAGRGDAAPIEARSGGEDFDHLGSLVRSHGRALSSVFDYSRGKPDCPNERAQRL
jgi:hypothetical protein